MLTYLHLIITFHVVALCKNGELIEMPFGGLTQVGPRSNPTNPFTLTVWRGVTSRRCCLLPN